MVFLLHQSRNDNTIKRANIQTKFHLLGGIKVCGPGRIRTCEDERQQIYSLPHLTALEPTHLFTANLRQLTFKSQLLTWSRLSDSNRRPTVYKTVALPAELRRRD